MCSAVSNDLIDDHVVLLGSQAVRFSADGSGAASRLVKGAGACAINMSMRTAR